MENIKKILDIIYSSKNGMMYFYSITSLVALIFIILIIVTIKKEKNKKEKNKKEISTREVDKQKNIDVLPNKNLAEIDNIENSQEKNISEENIELPKIKQEQSYQNISNEEFVKRLNELKNK